MKFNNQIICIFLSVLLLSHSVACKTQTRRHTQNDKHIAVLDKSSNGRKELVQGQPGSKKNSNIYVNQTFHETYETIGTCNKNIQTIKCVQTTVDTINCQTAQVDKFTNKNISFTILKDTKTTQNFLASYKT